MEQKHDQLAGGNWNAHKPQVWKKLREKHKKHKASGKGGPSMPEKHVPYGGAGKGDMNRITNQTKYSLGLDLIRLAKDKGKDSEEYKEALEAWRNA
tara:strand:- start:5710 stop:5997 length:288 start_codon:yes stop_codon:yes gene_type:complete